MGFSCIGGGQAAGRWQTTAVLSEHLAPSLLDQPEIWPLLLPFICQVCLQDK